MTSACDQCAKPVKCDEESVSCMAFCDRMIHLKCGCTKLNKAFLYIVHTSPNLFWMCNECAKLMKCARFKTAVSSFGSVINSITERQEIVHAELRKEMAKQEQQIAQLSKRIALTTPTNSDFMRQPPLKRRRDEGSLTGKPLVGGSKAVTGDNAFTEVLTVPEPTELFWLYLSRIHPSVKSESIEKLVKGCVQCEDPIKVVPLVKKGSDISRMSFILYKVEMDPKLREAALRSDTWPKGILFREFEDGSKNMWLPRLNTPTITISPITGPSEFSTPISGLDPVC
ncbi:uncharacterized protein LOC135714202 [Ochlerotatus camptorhynchus]|uniref:uncharacterized protein LOC135714202 n=1 Tax=Ochlerotatus camptorhynchus TaxID=644619 RepID=UPI0031D3B851